MVNLLSLIDSHDFFDRFDENVVGVLPGNLAVPEFQMDVAVHEKYGECSSREPHWTGAYRHRL